MDNFDNILIIAEKTLKNIRGIFDKNKVDTEIKKLEAKLLEENFWKNKSLAKKTIKQKKIFEQILNSYKKFF